MRTAQKRLPEEGLAIQPELHRNSGRITRQFSLNHNAIQHELQRGVRQKMPSASVWLTFFR